VGFRAPANIDRGPAEPALRRGRAAGHF